MQIEGEEVGRIGYGLIDPSHSSLESKKSLEERENAGVDPTLTIPMIQKGCTPIGEGTDSEPQAETVSCPFASLLHYSFYLVCLVSLHIAGKVCVHVPKPCQLAFPPSTLIRSIDKTENRVFKNVCECWDYLNEVDNKVDRKYKCHEGVHCLKPHLSVSSFLFLCSDFSLQCLRSTKEAYYWIGMNEEGVGSR